MPSILGTVMTRDRQAWPFLGHLLIKQIRIAVADLRNVPRYVLHALIGVAVVCGLLNLWASHGDGNLPGASALFGLDPYRISSAHCIEDDTSVEARWNGLAPALAILDQVNPAVSTWFREKHDNGLVIFGDKYSDPAAAQAKYDIFRGRVVVNRELFCENDGTIAAILCHEYRHSRQNLGKFCQHVLSFLVVRGGNLSIIENDAVIYEQNVQNAIFGNGRSRAKELAAWEHSAQLRNQNSKHVLLSPPCISAVAKTNQLP